MKKVFALLLASFADAEKRRDKNLIEKEQRKVWNEENPLKAKFRNRLIRVKNKAHANLKNKGVRLHRPIKPQEQAKKKEEKKMKAKKHKAESEDALPLEESGDDSPPEDEDAQEETDDVSAPEEDMEDNDGDDFEREL